MKVIKEFLESDSDLKTAVSELVERVAERTALLRELIDAVDTYAPQFWQDDLRAMVRDELRGDGFEYCKFPLEEHDLQPTDTEGHSYECTKCGEQILVYQ